MTQVSTVVSDQNAFVKVVHNDGRTEWKRFESADIAKHAAIAIELGLSDRETVTVSEFYDRYVEHYAVPKLKSDTVAGYGRVFNSHLRQVFGDKALVDLNLKDVTGFIETMRADGCGNRRIAPMLEVLSAMLGVAVRWAYITRNPVNDLDALLIGNAPQ